jgi:vacuolar-type H+-ATPase subunit D/Vma8
MKPNSKHGEQVPMSADLQSMRKKLKTQNGSHRMVKDPRKELSKYLNATQNASKPCRYAYYDLTKDVQRNAGDEIN